MAKIAVTGSTGFVGSNIAAVLEKYGHEVIGIGRRAPEVAPSWEIKIVDFTDVDSIAHGLEGCDAVVHCAISNEFNKLVENRQAGYDSFPGMTQRVTLAANKAKAKPILISTDWTMDEAMAFIVSGGAIAPETVTYETPRADPLTPGSV